MKTIVKIVHGSSLYGTAIPGSDTDIREVFQPSAIDILLQNCGGPYHKIDTIDTHGCSLKSYLDALAKGQPFALEMLFAPETFLIEWTATWSDVQRRCRPAVTKNCTPTFGHAEAMLRSEASGKQLYHALRLVTQQTELLLTGHMTFPRPEAHVLVDIRTGKLTPSEARCLIITALEELRNAERISKLPAEADQSVYNGVLLSANLRETSEMFY